MEEPRYFWQPTAMALLNPRCEARHFPGKPDRCESSRAAAHASDDMLPLPRGEPMRLPPATEDMDVEPYSSAVLRPLTAACVFRDCSLRDQATAVERRACRTLMRQAAIKWRHGLAMGDL